MKRISSYIIFLFIFLLPTQLGRHFFFPFSYLSGVRVDYLAPTIYLTDVLAFLLIILNIKTVFNFFLNKKILFVLGLLIINILFSLSPFVAMNRFIAIVKLLAIFAVFYNKASRSSSLQNNKNIFCAFFCGAVFQLILVIWQFISKHSIGGFFWFFGERYLSLSMPGIAKASLSGVEFLRPYGTFSHPNSMGGFYLLIYFFVLQFFNNQQLTINNLLKQVFLLICSFLIFLSFSKITIITFLILNILFLLTQEDTSRRVPTKFVCKPCVFTKIFSLFIVALIFISAKTDPQSLNNRIILIKNSMRIFFTHPFFGVGLGNYLIAQNNLSMNFSYYFQQPVHNIFLLWLTETGIIITIMVIWLMVKWFTSNKKPLAISYYLLAIVFITGFFDHYWLTLQQNFLLMAVIFAFHKSSTKI